MNHIKKISFIVMLVGLSLTSFPQTQISGNISSNQTLSGLIQVIGNVTINNGVTLTLNPGAIVVFEGYYSIQVNGTIKARGNSSNWITFTRSDTTNFSDFGTYKGGWGGIRFVYTLASNIPSEFTWCSFRFGKAHISGGISQDGGAMEINGYNNVTVEHCEFRDNYAHDYGGAIYLAESDAVLKNNVFYYNESGMSGGAAGIYWSDPYLESNMFANNKSGYGGAINFQESQVNLFNNIFANNEGSSGGAFFLAAGGNVLAINNTICNNKASVGGALGVSTQAYPVFYNNIIYGNTYTDGTPNQVYTGDLSPQWNFYYNNIQGGLEDFYMPPGAGFAGIYENNIDIDPAFVPGEYTAGSGREYQANTLSWELSQGSECINAGTTDLPDIPLILKDYDGNLRVRYSGVDLGAQEFYMNSYTLSGTVSEDLTITSDSLIITGDVTINNGYTLSINPGTLVEFHGYYRINILGSLNALGTKDDYIVFTINDTSGFSDAYSTSGSWRGMNINPAATNDSILLKYCVFRYSKRINSPDDYGGVMWVQGVNKMHIDHCLFEYNIGHVGGAIRASDSPLKITNSIFRHNRARAWAGAISCDFANVNMSGCLFEYNEAHGEGGAINVYQSRPVITNNVIRYNTSTGDGGGIQSRANSYPTITGNHIYNNSSGSGGGINVEPAAYISKNYVFNNQAGSGGGISGNLEDETILTNNVVANNTAYNGGGIYFYGETAKLYNNTIANNQASYYGGGIYVNNFSPLMLNNIVYGNTAGSDNSQVRLQGSNADPDILFCDIEGGLEQGVSSSGTFDGTYIGCIDSIPEFMVPSDGAGNGFDGVAADWNLKATSPCINSGSPNSGDIEHVLETDIRNQPRIHDDGIDMGASENQGTDPFIVKQPFNAFKCEGKTVVLFVQASDSVKYQWQRDGDNIEGANSATLILDSITVQDQGSYVCHIYNAYGGDESNPALVITKIPPTIWQQPDSAWVRKNDFTELKFGYKGTDPMNFQWFRNGVMIPGAEFPELRFPNIDYSHEGTYVCKLQNSCGTTETAEVALYVAPEICMVTVDTATGTNFVIWEKQSSAPIIAYNIYREGSVAGHYNLIGSVPYNDLSVFVDSAADPTVQAYWYKITAVDDDGNESDIDLCVPHKTIHLLVTVNPETGATQLDWDRYIGFNYGTFYILRSTEQSGFSIYHSMASTTTTWSDVDPGEDTYYYRVAVEKTGMCSPTGNLKAGSGPYSHSLSNIEDNRLQTSEQNNAPTLIELSKSTIAENLIAGSFVGILTTSDPDTNDIHSYSFVSGTGDDDNQSFTLLGNLLISAETFDYETKNSYSVRIKSTDNGTGYLSVEQVFAITILDAGEAGPNEAPTDISISKDSIKENMMPASLVGRFETTDPDAGDVHTYSLVSGSGDTDNSSFSIMGDLLITAVTFDYETQSSYTIRVKSTDNGTGNLYYEKVFTIRITDIDETTVENNAPTAISISNNTVFELKQPGWYIGRFYATDPDTDDLHTYALVPGSGDTNNTSFTIAGDLLLTAEEFDFESKDQYTIRVRATDNGPGNLYTEEIFIITVQDVDEAAPNQAPTDISLNSNMIDENKPVGTLIGRFTATDPNGQDTHTYSLVSGTGDDDNSKFSIIGDLLISADIFDYELKDQYSIRVRATDDGEGRLNFEKEFEVSVTDQMEVGIDEVDKGQVLVYPNPFDNSARLIFPNEEGSKYRLYIMDVSGKVVRIEDNITTSRYMLQRDNLKDGFYIIKLIGENTFYGRITLQK